MSKKTKRKYNDVRLSSQGVIASIQAKQCRKSRFYREAFASLIGSKETITGVISDIRRIKCNGRWMTSFVLNDVIVIGKEECGKTEHIWITCEKDFLKRNHLKLGSIPVLDGLFYEYRKKDSFGNKVRNIGFKLNYFKGRMCEYENQLRQSEQGCF